MTCAILAPAVGGAWIVPLATAAPVPAAIGAATSPERGGERFARNRNRHATPEAADATATPALSDAGSDAVLQDVGGQAVEAVDRIVGMPAAPTATPTPAIDLTATAEAIEATRAAVATQAAAATAAAEATAQAQATARADATRSAEATAAAEATQSANATATAEAAARVEAMAQAQATAEAEATAQAAATHAAEATRAAEATAQAAARAATATAQADATATAHAKAAASATAAADATQAARNAAATATALAMPRTAQFGVVDSVRPDAVGVRLPGQDGAPVVYQVAPNATITRDATPAALAALLPGDTIELRLDATDKARILTATAGQRALVGAVRDWWWTGFAPVFLLGLFVRARTREPFLLMAAPANGSAARRGDAQ